MSIFLSTMSVVLAYFIGAVPSSWVLVRLLSKSDMRGDPDGKISAASVYYRLGALPFAISVVMDMALAAIAVLLALWISGSGFVAMIAGLVAMIGHDWSPYLKFKGGQGATSLAGAMAPVMPVYLLIGMVVAIIATRLTKRSGLGTAIGVLAIALSALIWGNSFAVADVYPEEWLPIYPLALITIMFVKRVQLGKSYRNGPGSEKS